ncbi:MAG TPA: signal peptidase II [Thermoanaerobaculia bacterium]|nr:signal peptidase II [Thermoanaerobaculia bacterium]
MNAATEPPDLPLGGGCRQEDPRPAPGEAAAMTRAVRLALVAAVLLSSVGCDQVAKTLARASLATSPPVSLLDDCVRFELAQNRGAFLSLGEGLPGTARYLLFVVLVGGALALTLAFTLRLRSANPVQLVALSLLTGGGLGNLIDRLLHDGAVVDFVSIGVGTLRTGIFNIADAAITLGVLLLLIPWRRSSIFSTL